MQNRVIEIHDSAVDRIALEDGAAVIHFPSVYIHQSDGRPGIDAGTMWVQEAILRISQAEIEGAFVVAWDVWGGDMVYLYDGALRMGDVRLDDEIPIPLQFKGDAELLIESCGESIRVRGKGAVLELVGDAKYVEEFPRQNR